MSFSAATLKKDIIDTKVYSRLLDEASLAPHLTVKPDAATLKKDIIDQDYSKASG